MSNAGDLAFSQGDLMRRLRALERQFMEMQAGRRLENATVGQGGIRVKDAGTVRSDTFDGDMTAGNPGTTGWALGNERLALGGQLVGPIGFEFGYTEVADFTLNSTETTRATVTIPVPSWAEQALVQGIAVGNGDNDDGTFAFDLMGARVVIRNGNGPLTWGSSASFNQISAVTAAYSQVLNVAGTTSFDVHARVRTAEETWNGDPGFPFVALTVTTVFRRTS